MIHENLKVSTHRSFKRLDNWEEAKLLKRHKQQQQQQPPKKFFLFYLDLIFCFGSQFSAMQQKDSTRDVEEEEEEESKESKKQVDFVAQMIS